MNKLELFFCLLLVISFTQTEEIDEYNVTELYDKFTIIAKGMAETNETKCSYILINYRKTIFPVVKAVFENFNDKEKLNKIFTAAALPLMMIPNIVKDCNLNKIIDTLPKFINLKADEIKNIGQTVIDHADELEQIVKEFFGSTEIEGKYIAAGKIIRIITGISFQ